MIFKQFSTLRKISRVQYTGSLYVDKFEKTIGAHFIRPVAPILVLNGNIGKYSSSQTMDFLRHCNRIWKEILYVPGEYEVGTQDYESKVATMKKIYKSLENVHVLHNSTKYIPSIDTLFMGTIDNKEWVRSEFVEKNQAYPLTTKFVALTNYVPDTHMIHPIDKKHDINVNYDIYPSVNAWICGYSRGAKSHTYANGVLCAYNSRGPIDGKNDFSQTLGWSRSACLDIPETVPSST